MSMIHIASHGLSAAISPLGAELSSLCDVDGRHLLHDRDPAWWGSSAPLLFPIVGGLRGDSYRLGGRQYMMGRHGIARRQNFVPVEQSADHVLLRLIANEETRLAYPFAFRFEADYRIDGASLTMTFSATNEGGADMPVSMGYHPAFAWPLPYGQGRADHRILFDEAEPETLCLLDADGLILAQDRASPVAERSLALTDEMFAHDALIWRDLHSRGCLYGAPQGRQLRITWSDMPSLGIWTKPGAPYVCIEPWDGLADPAGFDGDIWEKPGIRRVAPGDALTHWMRITLQAEPA